MVRYNTPANDLRRIVDETSTIDPELRKELLYSWEHGFIEDKPQEQPEQRYPNLLRKDENRKSDEALMHPLKGKVRSETLHTVETAAGAVHRKSDIAESKIDASAAGEKSLKKDQLRSPHGEEQKKS